MLWAKNENVLAAVVGLTYCDFPVDDAPAPNSPGHPPPGPSVEPHRRRPRYLGKYPRLFEQKYKEHDPKRFPETFHKVLDSGKTPAGTHRPIMVEEVLAVLAPQPGEMAVDCTLGYGGHAQALLPRLLPGGKLIGLDQDPIELPSTEARLRAIGFGPEVFTAQRGNFAGLGQVLAKSGLGGADVIFADLGVSSMQLDDPKRGFSLKHDGPLDMRMNPGKGQPASRLLEAMSPDALAALLAENADEPRADLLGKGLAGRLFATTGALVAAIRGTMARVKNDEVDLSIRRTFQALRIAVNDEFSVLDALLRQLPACLNRGGRAAILTFHSGEDRRVKRAFASGLREGVYAEIALEVIRPTATERYANPRSAPAKLRWARAKTVRGISNRHAVC
jgi:16S rRNA (cytosine1402-N4)-methyltransferase